VNATNAQPADVAHRDADESVLVSRISRGDPAACEQLVRAYGGRLLVVARRILGSDEDAADALQDGFLAAFRSISTFSGGSQLGTWLHRIVVNAALMKLRKRRRRREQPIDDLLPRFLSDGHQSEPAGRWTGPSDAGAAGDETRRLVREAISKLPENYRIVLLLRDIEELDTEATAELLGMSVNAVKTRLHRARQALRTLLDPHFRREEL
jgi:RNA polymerase sigma-70 factor (ECF subfamily)